MSEPALRVAVVGCGNISGAYGETMGAYPSVRIAGATDVDRSLSAAFVDRFGGVNYPSLDDVLGDPDVDAIVNLTFPAVHAEVTTAALNAGKHVHSEKPLAGNYAAARSLVDLADDRGLRLSCSPITFLGEAQQTMWRLVESGAIGSVRVAYAEANWNRIESWHPRPEPFYRIGPFADVGVYPLTILTAMFGPARRVTAFGTVVYPDRTTTDGRAVHARGAGLRRRRRRARERHRRASHCELLRLPPARSRAGSSSTATRARSTSPTGRSSTRRSSSHGSASRTRTSRWRMRSRAPTGDARSAS